MMKVLEKLHLKDSCLDNIIDGIIRENPYYLFVHKLSLAATEVKIKFL